MSKMVSIAATSIRHIVLREPRTLGGLTIMGSMVTFFGDLMEPVVSYSLWSSILFGLFLCYSIYRLYRWDRECATSRGGCKYKELAKNNKSCTDANGAGAALDQPVEPVRCVKQRRHEKACSECATNIDLCDDCNMEDIRRLTLASVAGFSLSISLFGYQQAFCEGEGSCFSEQSEDVAVLQVAIFRKMDEALGDISDRLSLVREDLEDIDKGVHEVSEKVDVVNTNILQIGDKVDMVLAALGSIDTGASDDPVKVLVSMGYSWGIEGLAAAITSFDRYALTLFHEGGMRFHDYQMAMGVMQAEGHATARALFQRYQDTQMISDWLDALVSGGFDVNTPISADATVESWAKGQPWTTLFWSAIDAGNAVIAKKLLNLGANPHGVESIPARAEHFVLEPLRWIDPVSYVMRHGAFGSAEAKSLVNAMLDAGANVFRPDTIQLLKARGVELPDNTDNNAHETRSQRICDSKSSMYSEYWCEYVKKLPSVLMANVVNSWLDDEVKIAYFMGFWRDKQAVFLLMVDEHNFYPLYVSADQMRWGILESDANGKKWRITHYNYLKNEGRWSQEYWPENGFSAKKS